MLAWQGVLRVRACISLGGALGGEVVLGGWG